MGRGDQLRRRGQRARCATSSSTTRSTGRGVPLRRPAPGRRARDRRRLAPRHPRARLARRVRAGPGRDAPRPPRARERPQRGAPPRARRRRRAARVTAQWNDDLHHAAHVLLTGETRRLLRRLRATTRWRSSAARWPKASPTRASRRRIATARRAASRSAHLPPDAFVTFLQNHDQVGNRAFGERLHRARAAPRRCAPRSPRCCWRRRSPMLFMGEEFGADTPFLTSATSTASSPRRCATGRRARVRAASARFADAAAREHDSRSERAARPSSAAELDWDERRARAARRHGSRSTRRCSRCARDAIVPRLAAHRARGGALRRATATALRVRWPLADGARSCTCVANFGDGAPTAGTAGRRRSCVEQRRGRHARRWRVALDRRAGALATHERTTLDALCARYGIATRYHDVFGNGARAARARRMRALLAAMGVDACTSTRCGAGTRARRAPLARVRRRCRAAPRRRSRRRGRACTLRDARSRARSHGASRRGRRRAHDGPRRRRAPARRRGEHVGGMRVRRLPLPPPADGYHRAAHRSGTRSTTLRGRRAAALLPPPAPTARRASGARASSSTRCARARNWGIGDFTRPRARSRDVAARTARAFVGAQSAARAVPRTTRRRRARTARRAASRSIRSTSTSRRSTDFARRARRRATSRRRRTFQARLARCARRAGRLRRRRGARSARCWTLLYAHFRDAAPRTRRRDARPRVPRVRRRRSGERARDARAVRGAAGELPRRRSRRLGLAGVARGLPRSATRGGAALSRATHARRASTSTVPAVAGATCSSHAPRTRARDARHGDRPLRDLAVGANPGGAETWQRPDALCASACTSARRPTSSTAQGQDWGLPPLDPAPAARAAATRRSSRRCAPTCAHAGALRIDHVMGLLRLYWIPARHDAARRRLRALSARRAARRPRAREPAPPLPGDRRGPRHRARRSARRAARRRRAVVPRAVLRARRRRRLQARPPTIPRRRSSRSARTTCRRCAASSRARPRRARRARLFPAERAARARACASARPTRRASPTRWCAKGCCRVDATRVACALDDSIAAVHAYLARTPCALMMVQLEDVIGEARAGEPAGDHRRPAPNWRRKLAVDLEDWDARRPLRGAARAAIRAQGRGSARRDRSRRASRARPTACSCTATSPSTMRARSCPTSRALGISHLYCSPFLRRARRQHARLRRRRPRRAQSRDRRRRPTSTRFARAARARHGPDARHRAQPHGRAEARQRVVARRARERPGLALRRASSTSTGSRRARTLRGKVLLPVLGDQYGACSSAASSRCASSRAPASCRCATTSTACRSGRPSIRACWCPASIDCRAMRPSSRARPTSCASSPSRSAPCRSPRRADRSRAMPRAAGGAAKAALAALCARVPAVARSSRRTSRRINGIAGEPRSFDALHALLERQAYRLAYWRVAADEINYRRFFDINDLAALRAERDDVFEATHGARCRPGRAAARSTPAHRPSRRPARPGAAISTGCSRPRRMRRRRDATRGCTRPRRLRGGREDPRGARAPAGDWPVHGTTGYRFMNVVNGAVRRPDGARALRPRCTRHSSASTSTSTTCCGARRR